MDTTSPAVLFAPQDYASILRRIIAAAIDVGLMIVVLSAVGDAIVSKYVPESVAVMPPSPKRQELINKYVKPIQVQAVAGLLAFCAAYHIGLRRLRLGTLGYVLAGVRIVNAAGDTPGWTSLGKRFVLAVPLVGLFGVSYLICRQNPRRQAFHDQWSGTWVVRSSAKPVGPAKPAFQTKFLGPIFLTYLDLEPADAAPVENAALPTQG